MREHKSRLLQLIYVFMLVAVVLPLLIVAPFDRPGADDFSYGAATYRSISNGEGVLGVLRATFSTVGDTYIKWEGRYSCVFLDSLMPGIWNERFYGITPFILILSLIFCEIYLIYALLGENNRKNVLPIIIPGLIMQILFVSSIVESFYWYTGAINYTFIHSLSFLFIGLFYKLIEGKFSQKKSVIVTVIASMLAVIIGGGNFSTSLYTVLTILIMLVVISMRNKKLDIKCTVIGLLLFAGFIIAILAPGNSLRIDGNFSGMTLDPLTAVWMSVTKTCVNIWLWSNIAWFRPVLLMLIPFICHAVRKMDWSFRLPLLFTVITIGIFSSQIVATMYVDGTVGGGRSVSILLYSYWIWAILNMTYWIGWIYRKTGFKIKSDRIKFVAKKLYDNPGKVASFFALITITVLCVTLQIKSVSTTRAVKDLITGRAAGYAREWDERYAVLHDESQSDVVFRRLENRPETLFYTDFEYEEQYMWVNSACATYYGKDSITVTLD